MFRQYSLFLLPIFLLFLLSVCRQQTDPAPSESSVITRKFCYSNLTDENAVAETKALLEAAGVPSDNIQQVLQWAEDFNQCMADCPGLSLAGPFTNVEGTTVDYGDEFARNRHWYRTKKRPYPDILCRIAAFALCQDKISVETPLEKEQFDCWDFRNSWLYSDGQILFGSQATEEEKEMDPYPLLHWQQHAIARYFTLFQPVSCPADADENTMLQAIQDVWQQQGISFREEAYSLLTFWRQTDASLAVSHAAVLAETQDGFLLFEKTNPESPYSAAKFRSLADIRGYLYGMMEADLTPYGIEVGPYLLLRDDQPLD